MFEDCSEAHLPHLSRGAFVPLFQRCYCSLVVDSLLENNMNTVDNHIHVVD